MNTSIADLIERELTAWGLPSDFSAKTTEVFSITKIEEEEKKKAVMSTYDRDEIIQRFFNLTSQQRLALLRCYLLGRHPECRNSIEQCPDDALGAYALRLEQGLEGLTDALDDITISPLTTAPDLSPLRTEE